LSIGAQWVYHPQKGLWAHLANPDMFLADVHSVEG